jgi:hypothetical protein
MPEYGELKTNETNEETEPFDIENGSEEKIIPEKRTCLKNIYIIFIALLLILSYPIYVYIYTYLLFSTPSTVSNIEYFNFTQDIVDSPSVNDLTAYFHSGHKRYPRTCDDLQYGCCKVYSQCEIKNGYLNYKDLTLSHYKIVPQNRIKSNCYSLDHLVHLWNIEYKSENASETCENSPFGCCKPINTACDLALRNNRENNQDSIDFYKQHLRHSHRITVPKKDKEGSNCPEFRHDSTFNIVYAFNHGYPNQINDLYFFLALLSSLGFIFCISK